MSLYLPLALLLVALILFWHSNRQLRRAGLPGGRIIYTDTRGWGKLEKPLIYAPLELTGKPDYLVEKEGSIIPVEVKSGRAPAVPYDSHIYQLAAYCLLVEMTFGKQPAYGIPHYTNRDFAIDYSSELEASLLIYWRISSATSIGTMCRARTNSPPAVRAADLGKYVIRVWRDIPLPLFLSPW